MHAPVSELREIWRGPHLMVTERNKIIGAWRALPRHPWFLRMGHDTELNGVGCLLQLCMCSACLLVRSKGVAAHWAGEEAQGRE